MDSTEIEDSVRKKREMLLRLQQRIEKATSDLKASGSTASPSTDLQNLSKEIQQLLMTTAKSQDPSKATLRINDGIKLMIQYLSNLVLILLLILSYV